MFASCMLPRVGLNVVLLTNQLARNYCITVDHSPRFANSLAVSFPMPVFAPVTMIVLPARDTASIVTQLNSTQHDSFL